MLKELSKKDNLWRELAFKICNNKQDADDLVNEMYLRRYENNRGQKLTDYYIVSTMWSIYNNQLKKRKPILCANLNAELHKQITTDEIFEPDDRQFELLEKTRKLAYAKRELLELSFDESLRSIQRKYNINYGYVHRANQQSRKRILGKDFIKYKNKRLKHRKMKEQSMGLGDTIAKITKATGIKRLVELMTDDCGCDKRKEWLNRHFQYKRKPKCLTTSEIKQYQKWVDNRPLTLTGKGKAKGKLEKEDVTFITEFHALVFNTEVFRASCFSCSGTAKALIKMVYQLDTVWINNVNAPAPDGSEELDEMIEKAKNPNPKPTVKVTTQRRITENLTPKPKRGRKTKKMGR